MSEFNKGDYIVRVRSFDTKKVLLVVNAFNEMIECNDGLFYSINPKWTRHATPKEIEQGYRDE